MTRGAPQLTLRILPTTVLVLALGAAPAAASISPGHVPAVVVPMAGILGSVFGGIGHAVLGAFSWTFHLAAKFILVTLGALVKLLVPRAWAREGVQVFQWIVAIPDYAGTITSPGGHTSYGFAGVNDIRQLFQWLGLALLPLTLVYSTGRAMLGHGEPVAAPAARVVGLAGALVSYAWWWAQAAALVNQMTRLILSPAVVTEGIHKLMLYATDGIALGGWQLIDLGLMAALGIELLALIFVKVVVILLGALLFATGPLMLGLVPTASGAMIARAWLTAVMTLLALPVAWAAVFAVGAVLVVDAGTAGPLIGGSSTVGSLLGGVILAIAGAATLWLCLRAAREVGGLLRLQLGGLLVLARTHHGHSARPAGAPTAAAGRAASSIRTFQSRVRDATTASLTAAGPAGQGVLGAAGIAGGLGRRGLIISGGQALGTLGRTAVTSPAGRAARQHLAAAALTAGDGDTRVGRAGAVASRMARAGHTSWRASSPTPRGTASPTGGSTRTAGEGQARDAARQAAAGVPRPHPADGATATGQPQRPAPANRNSASDARAPDVERRSAARERPAPADRDPARPTEAPGETRASSRKRINRAASSTSGQTRSARRPASPPAPPRTDKRPDSPPSPGSDRD